MRFLKSFLTCFLAVSCFSAQLIVAEETNEESNEEEVVEVVEEEQPQEVEVVLEETATIEPTPEVTEEPAPDVVKEPQVEEIVEPIPEVAKELLTDQQNNDDEIKYELWIGNIQVTSQNASDVLGNGTVIFNPTENILQLKNANITESSSIYDDVLNGKSNIQSYGGKLIIQIEGTNNISGADYGLFFNASDITFTGNGILYVEGKKSGILANACNYSMTGGEVHSTGETGILLAYSGLSMQGGTIKAVGNQDVGLNVDMLFDFKGGKVNASGVTKGISIWELGMAEDMMIAVPKGAVVKLPDIYESDGFTVAKQVVIEQGVKPTVIQIDDLEVLTSFVYDGTEKVPFVNNIEGVVWTGNTGEVNCGEYTLTAELIDPELYIWSDGLTENKTWAWIIGPADLSAPETKTSITGVVDKTYNGKAQTQTPTVKATIGGKTVTLKKDTDYTISYKNNVNIGTATMTITGKGNYKGSVSKTFKINPIAVTGIKLNKTSTTITEGKSETLKATITPSNATNKTVTWTSSNKTIATVDKNGKVTAKKAGTVTITAKSSNGKTATCKITVSPDIKACEVNPNVGWETKNGKMYWYEKIKGTFVKQGTYGSKGNVWYDGTERGREIYDPCSDGWYWLDAKYEGAKAVNKEVFMPYIYSNEDTFDEATINNVANESNNYTENGIKANMGEQVRAAIENGSGKWVRYDENGKMYKGWYTVEEKDRQYYRDQVGNTYYYDYKTGLMAKGWTIIDGQSYYFDPITGVLTDEAKETILPIIPVLTPEPTPATEYREVPAYGDYIGHIYNKVFHDANSNCPSMRRMNPENKFSYSGARQQMIDWGYRPCKNCNP